MTDQQPTPVIVMTYISDLGISEAQIADALSRATNHHRTRANERAAKTREMQDKINETVQRMETAQRTMAPNPTEQQDDQTDQPYIVDAGTSVPLADNPWVERDPAHLPQLQVLYLPEDSREQQGPYPFALVLSGVPAGRKETDRLIHQLHEFAKQCGARAALLSELPINVP